MRALLRKTLTDLRSSYWFLPAVLTILAALLSVATWWLDTRLSTDWMSATSYFSPAKPEGARTILSTVAGSMISVAGTVFAITFAAVVYASGSYGPRLLTNFMTDRGNQLSLGVFIATFVYALLTLREIRLPEEGGALTSPGGGFVPQISLLTALGLAMLSVGVLVYFLHHVPNSIRINNVVADVARTALHQIEKRYPDVYRGHAVDTGEASVGEPVTALDTGYVEVIDYGTLGNVTEEGRIGIRLAVRTGDFIHPGMALVYVDGGHDEDCDDAIRSAFATGTSRTPTQDIEFSVDELVEIALRALSPGINDPFTAITCIHWIAATLASLGGRDLARDADGRLYGTQDVYCLADEFEHFVRRSAVAMSVGVAANDLASIVFVEAMASAAPSCATDARRQALLDATGQMVEQARLAQKGPALDRLEHVWTTARPRFEAAVG